MIINYNKYYSISSIILKYHQGDISDTIIDKNRYFIILRSFKTN